MRRLFYCIVPFMAAFSAPSAHSAVLASELNVLTAAWHGCLLSTVDKTAIVSWEKDDELNAVFDKCMRQEDAVLSLMQRADVSVEKARLAMRAFAIPYLVSQTKLVSLKASKRRS